VIKLEHGDDAPPFSLRDQHGDVVSLSDFSGRKVLVYFYPEADTSGCTRQSCSIRDAGDDLSALGAEAIGISPDLPEKQDAFDRKYGLGFRLLSDPDHAVSEAYGVWGEKIAYGRKTIGMIRSSFLIDEHGRIERAWYRVKPEDTVPKAMATLSE
jgi:thioredoxin-dependent peroxiredoxin